MKWMLLFLSLSIVQTAHAGIGRSLPRSEVFHQQCFMDYGNMPDRYSEICTGILIDQSTILTAAHCVVGELPKRVSCGPNAESVEIDRVSVHRDFNPRTIIEDTSYLVKDLALIQLSRPVPAEKVPLMTMGELSQASRCAFFGYSKLSGRSRDIAPVPQFGWEVSKHALELWSEHQLIRLHGLRAPGGLSEVGDSGGPLMCQVNGRWQLLGIASSRDFNYHSLFTPVIDSALSIPASPHSLELERLARKQQREFVAQQREREKEELLKSIERIPKLSSLAEIGASADYASIYLDALKALFDQSGVVGRLKTFSTFQIGDSPKTYSIGDLAYNYFEVQEIDFVRGEVRGRLKVLGPSDVFICAGEILCNEEVIPEVRTNLHNLQIYMLDKMPRAVTNFVTGVLR